MTNIWFFDFKNKGTPSQVCVKKSEGEKVHYNSQEAFLETSDR